MQYIVFKRVKLFINMRQWIPVIMGEREWLTQIIAHILVNK